MTLPVGRVARSAYASVLCQPRALARHAAMPWIVVMAGFALAGLPDGSWWGGPQRSPLTGLVIAWGPGLSFTVTWTRRILLGEDRRWLAAPRFGRREGAMLALAVLLPLAAVAPIALPLALGMAAGAGLAADVAVTALVAAVALWAIALTLRAALAFALVALDAGAAALARSWRATHGHALAMLGLLLLTELPAAVVQGVVPLAFADAAGGVAWLELAIETAIAFAAAAIGASAAALASRHLDPALAT